MKKYVFALTLMVLMTSGSLFAQKRHMVHIQDQGIMAAQGNRVPAITLWMPDALIEEKRKDAKNQFLEYTPSDEDKNPALLVYAQGFVGKTITGGRNSITRIVLLSEKNGGIVKEAYFSETVSKTFHNNMGAAMQ